MNPAVAVDPRLLDTQRAFDSVAADYDGPLGNNELIQVMRARLWRSVLSWSRPGARLLDLGCGTGIDAAFFATQGRNVVAIDWSPKMVERARARAAQAGLADRVRVEQIGIQELDGLAGEKFDLVYSDLGPFNCVPDLRGSGADCAGLLLPGGKLVVSVIGRVCPWELAFYAARRDWRRFGVRGKKGSVPVNLNGETVWTRYYTPREFYRELAGEFELDYYCGLGLYIPPPYLSRLYQRMRPIIRPFLWLDEHASALPFFRDLGDSFLMVMTKRD